MLPETFFVEGSHYTCKEHPSKNGIKIEFKHADKTTIFKHAVSNGTKHDFEKFNSLIDKIRLIVDK